ncbi:methyltransferase domain-containing protein [Candidatus Pacearchaeota archaeon]|nr:methyltransferase domain-containing protein [Candidatus Pacearchaeota archaeon]
MRNLNFGCGRSLRVGWDNCDVQKGERIISFDFNKFPYPFKDNTYDLIESRSVLQMLNEPDNVLDELWRIAKNGARINIEVPYWNNKGAYNDIQTKHIFNENSFINFAEQKPCRVDTKIKLKIRKIEIDSTKVGRLFPEALRKKLNLFFSGIYSNMKIEFEVIK